MRRWNRNQDLRTVRKVESAPELVWQTKISHNTSTVFLPPATERQQYWTTLYEDHDLPSPLLYNAEATDLTNFTATENETAIQQLKDKTRGKMN